MTSFSILIKPWFYCFIVYCGFIVVVGAHRNNAITLYLNNQLIPCVNKFKYLGINFIAKRTLTVDTASIKRKFYAACNSVLVSGKYSSEIVQVELIKSYCLPILVYSLGALEMNASLIQELMSVCWNNGFRKKN